jgi:RNA polymerase sigma factor (sigma-70 family)
MTEVTRILSAIEEGDPQTIAQAAEQLLPLVYEELRKLAAQRLAQEKSGQTLQATALVHEAYLRLVASPPREPSPHREASPQRELGESPLEEPHWHSRGHFFAAAAEAMRRILVERARRRRRDKHGGRLRRVDLIDAEVAAVDADSDEAILLLDEALTRLADARPQAAKLVKLRFFSGVTVEEAARMLDLSPRTARRLWAYARAWLRRDMERAGGRPGGRLGGSAS